MRSRWRITCHVKMGLVAPRRASTLEFPEMSEKTTKPNGGAPSKNKRDCQPRPQGAGTKTTWTERAPRWSSSSTLGRQSGAFHVYLKAFAPQGHVCVGALSPTMRDNTCAVRAANLVVGRVHVC